MAQAVAERGRLTCRQESFLRNYRIAFSPHSNALRSSAPFTAPLRSRLRMWLMLLTEPQPRGIVKKLQTHSYPRHRLPLPYVTVTARYVVDSANGAVTVRER